MRSRSDASRSTRPTRSRPSAAASSSPIPSCSTSTATRSGACRWPRASACARWSTSGARSSWAAGRPAGSRRRGGRATLIAPIIGAPPGTVVVTDSVTVNLYKLAAAAHRGGPLVTPASSFPTDRYVLEGLAAERGVELRLGEDIEGAGLVVWSQVDYRTGELADVPGITQRCRDAGVPLDLGPQPLRRRRPRRARAPRHRARRRLHLQVPQRRPRRHGLPLRQREERVRPFFSPIWGWFAQADQFDMDRPFDPQPGIERFLAGTPSPLVLAAVEEGARLTAEAGIDALRAKSIALQELLIEGLPEEVELASPADPERRGSHVAIRHPRRERAERAPDRGQGDRRLPHARPHSPRGHPALHPLRRRLGRDGPAARNRQGTHPAVKVRPALDE